MAVIARSLLLSVLACGLLLAEKDAPSPLRTVNQVATALADNDAAEAIRHFAASMPERETLRQYFDNLAASYNISCEADIVDEQDTPTTANLTLDWTLTLQNRSTDATVRRRQQVQVRLSLAKGEWTIVALAPLSLFSPQM